jgi:uncharacterized delta-60 repeat protein
MTKRPLHFVLPACLLAAVAGAQPNQSWLARYNSVARNDDAAQVAVDRDGNVIVTGWSAGGGPDFLTVKYSPSGTELWTRRLDRGNPDYPYALALDDSGNVYLTGMTGLGTSNSDYLTVKYSASGEERWIQTVDGEGHRTDYGRGIATDLDGNVVVTGECRSGRLNTDFDCVTVKYSPTGVRLWTTTFNRRDSVDDQGKVVAVDGAGNIYVCGLSTADVLLLKLRPNGDTVWSRYCTGTGQCCGYSVRLDSDNRIVIGGILTTSTAADLFCAAYDSAGNRQWLSSWNGPLNDYEVWGTMTTDTAGNAYVCGSYRSAPTNMAAVVVKYNAVGARQWVGTFNGPDTTGADHFASVVAGASGDVYASGRSWSPEPWRQSDYITVKFNATGQQQWQDRFDGSGASQDEARCIAFDSAGGLIVTGSSRNEQQDLDYVTFRYTTAGARASFATYAGPGGPGNSYDCGRFVGRDGAGNLYVAGRVEYGAVGLLKYDDQGRLQWQRTTGYGQNADAPVGLHVTVAGDVLLLAKSARNGLPNTFVYHLLRYNSLGDTIWTRAYFGPDSLGCTPSALCVDGQENCYITGSSSSAAALTSWHTVKFLADGSREWAVTTPRPDTLHPLNPPTCIGCDSAGAVFIGSSLDTITSFFEDHLLVKLNPNGSEAWRRRYDGPGHQFDEARVLAVDAQGNCIVSGYSWGDTSGYDVVTIKYSPDGDTLWARRYAGPGGLNDEDEPTALLLDGAGNVHVAVRSWADSSMDYVTLKYNADGAQQWASRYDAPGAGTDVPHALGLDAEGNVYVTGQAWNPGTLWDFVTIGYTPGGVQRWVASVHAGNYYDEAWDMVVAGVDHLYVTGGSAFPGADYDVVTVAYGAPGAVEELGAAAGLRLTVSQTVVRGRVELRCFGAQAIRIYDAAGRTVHSISTSGASAIAWDGCGAAGSVLPAGVYYCRAFAAGRTGPPQKLLLVR